MADRPIIFSGPMVRALLDGRKTQTRRVLKPQPIGVKAAWCYSAKVWNILPESPRCSVDWAPPRYARGDRLYVRETHALVPSSAYRCSPGVPYAVNDEDPYQACVYREGWERSQPGTGWRSSILMPRWASRLTLTVTDVRVQRLQEITEADAVAEGVCDHDPVCGYSELWDILHGPEAWDENPWVVALTFTVQHGNIDQIGGGS